MTLTEVKRLENYGHFPLVGVATKNFPNDLDTSFTGILNYLGLLNKKGSTCGLKGLMLIKKEEGQAVVGTELAGSWFSGSPASGVITDFIDREKCEWSILDSKGKIVRVYGYYFLKSKSWETTIRLEMVQHHAFSPLNLLNPTLIHIVIYRVLRGILPYDVYNDIRAYLPNTFLDSIAKDALPSFFKN